MPEIPIYNFSQTISCDQAETRTRNIQGVPQNMTVGEWF